MAVCVLSFRLQINLIDSSASYIHEEITVGQSVLRDMYFDEHLQEVIIATSSNNGSQVNYCISLDIEFSSFQGGCKIVRRKKNMHASSAFVRNCK